MRNLKKFLALVLALMMAFSLMVTANAAINTSAAVTDKDSVTEEFKEAVAVLNGLGIITGYQTGDNEFEFRPSNPISRQETTALIYRLHSGDVKDTKNDLYSTADNIKQFTDVKADGAQKWSAGYIGYCANQGIIKGVSDTRFAPASKVTGYQVLAMVLRAIGYGQNKEYEGTGWQTRVATTATQLGLLKNVTNTNYSTTLNSPATRELVAEIIFQAALQPTVTYTVGFGYIPTGTGLAGGTHGSLSTKNFNLRISGWEAVDEWGRPGYRWTDGSKTVATISYEYTKQYTDVQRECDVAHDLGIESSENFRLFVNGNTRVTDTYKIMATDTVTKVGGNGRLTEIYKGYSRPWNLTTDGSVVAGSSTGPNIVVMMDTMLAKVVSTTDAVLDKAGHVITPAKMTVNVFSVNGTNSASTNNAATNVSEPRTISKGATDTTNWTYNRGDVILMNAYTVASNRTGNESKEKTAFETDVLVADKDLVENKTVFILGAPESKVGKQTLIYWNQGKHQIDGEDKIDALTFDLDAAKTNINTTYKWYFDKYGNVIGVDEVDALGFGVITDIYAAFGTGDANTSTTGTAQAVATVLMADGSTQTITIDRFLVKGDPTATSGAPGTHYTATAGDMIDGNTSDSNSIELWPMYDTTGKAPLESGSTTVTIPKINADANGFLYMAPAAISNKNGHNAATTSDKNGILFDNMFKFVKTANDQVVAVEVAGTANNTGIYDGNYSALNPTTTSGSNDDGKVWKNRGFVSSDAAGNNPVCWLDDETKIIVRNNITDNKLVCYNGVSSLPGDILIDNTTAGNETHFGSEIDWADTDGDGRAEYLYVTGTIDGVVTYGMFFYNAQENNGSWNGTIGTLAGYLNGEPATLTFEGNTGKAMFDQIRTSTNYAGRLWAIKQFNGVVADVMISDRGDGNWRPQILHDTQNSANTSGFTMGATWGSAIIESSGVAANVFGLGADEAKWGNPYSAVTSAIYFKDEADGTVKATDSDKYEVKYTQDDVLGGTVTVTGRDNSSAAQTYVYHLTPNSKIIGNLSYLNEYSGSDVTIVYQGNASRDILEIYVTTDPNITPTPPSSSAATKPGMNVTDLSSVYDDPAADRANLETAIKNAGSGVFYNSKVTATTGGTTPAAQALYFAFTATGASPSIVTLQIRDSANKVVYSESSTSVSGVGGHLFAINFTKQGATGSWYTTPGLEIGKVYSYSITGSDVIEYTGTFSMTK